MEELLKGFGDRCDRGRRKIYYQKWLNNILRIQKMGCKEAEKLRFAVQDGIPRYKLDLLVFCHIRYLLSNFVSKCGPLKGCFQSPPRREYSPCSSRVSVRIGVVIGQTVERTGWKSLQWRWWWWEKCLDLDRQRSSKDMASIKKHRYFPV